VGVGVSVDVRQAPEPAGTVVSQSPEPGTWIGRGGRVDLVVSSGPPPVAVPAFAAGRAPGDVHNALLIAGFAVGTDIHRNDERVAAGGFIATAPAAGAKVAPGSTIRIVISDGPAPRQVPPNLAGLTYAQAAAQIQAVQLQPVQAMEFSDTIQAGRVTRTDPVGNTPVPRDSPVRVYISQGPQLVLVPNVTTWKVEDASAILQGDGLVVDVQGYKPHGHVKTQSLAANSQVHVGTTIILTL
jgi:beta-lactam-binding protein with PASTA domain